MVFAAVLTFAATAKAALNAGDIAFVMYNADATPDTVAFVALVDIPAGEQIKFTDNGWRSTNVWRTGEGIDTYTAPAGGLSRGTVVTVSLSAPVLSTSGDQIIAYQDTSTMIAALNNDGAGVWQADATSANTSALPQGLVNGTTAVAINEIDNARYNGTLSGTKEELLAAINNNANWDRSDSTVYTWTLGSFTVGSAAVAPTVTTGSASSIAATSVTLGGNITATGGADATERGIYYSTTDGFADGTGTKVSAAGTFSTGAFTQNVTGLTAGTTYYFKAFAVNSAGTSYGSQGSFLTVPGTPATPTASSVTSTDFTVNWSATMGAASYRLDVSTASNFATFVSGYNNLTVNGTSQAVTGLSPATTYYVRIRAVNASGTGANSDTLTQATTGVPEISIESPDGTAIESGGSRGSFGTVTVGSSADFLFVVRNSGSAALNVSGITFGGTHSGDFAVVGSSTAAIAAGDSASFTIRFTPAAAGARSGTVTFANDDADEGSYLINLSGEGSEAAVAPTVTTSAASGITASGATLNGNVNADGGAAVTEHGFVYSSTDATPTSGEVGVITEDIGSGTGVISFAATGLGASVTYYYRAYAINSVGTTYGDVQSFTTLKAEPSAHATSFTTGTITTSNIPLTWTAASPQPDGYLIRVSSTTVADPTDGTAVADDTDVAGGGAINVAGDATSYSGFTGFAAGTTYTFKIYPYNNSGTDIDYRTAATVPAVTSEVLPAAPEAPTFASVTSTGFTVNWNAVSGADSYRLDVSTASNFATFVSGYQDLTVAGTSQAVTGLAANTTYYARVRAVNTSGAGANSTSGNQTTAQLSAPTTEAATDITTSGFTANWNAVTGATGYQVDVYSDTTQTPLATDLIISEYIDGSSGTNKGIEIYNGTGAAVDLSDYRIWIVTNGGSWPETSISLTGILPQGETYVVSNGTDFANLVAASDLTTGSLSFNGDDAIGLARNISGTWTLIDAIGTDGADPGTGWAVAGVNNATADRVLRRKGTVISPTTDWDASRGTTAENSQWIVSDGATNAEAADFGQHTLTATSTTSFVDGFENFDAGNATSLEVTGLAPGTEYSYVVRATSATSTSADSDVRTVTTLTPTPTIAASGTLSAVSTTYGTASAAPTSFTVSGADMAAGITVTPSAGFEVAASSDFSTTVGTSLSPLTVGGAGTIASTTIYVRLAAGAGVSGSPYSGDIVLTSSGAATVNVATAASTVTAKELTVTGLTGANKVYDRTMTASVSGTAALDGIVEGDTVTLTGTPSFTFASAAVGTGVQITAAGYTLGGGDAANYTLAQPTGLTADITAKALTVSGATAQTRVYDGTTSAAISGATLVGVESGDTVTLSGGGAFADKLVGAGKSVTAALSLGGADASNYTLEQPAGLTADITVKELTVTGATATGRDYDGTTVVAVAGGSLSGVVGGDAVTLGGSPSGAIADSSAGAAKSVTVAGFEISGADATNYTLTQPTLSADIAQKALTVTANRVIKPFGDTLTSGPGSTGFTSSGLVSPETIGSVTITYTAGEAADDAAGTYPGAVVPSAATGGTFTAGNYDITYVAGDLEVSSAPVPTIQFSGTPLAVSAVYGSPSAPTSFSVTGTDMEGVITATAPSGFEVSLSESTGYAASVQFGSSGTVSATTIYVRLAAGTALGVRNGFVALTASNAVTVNVALAQSEVTAKALTVDGAAVTTKAYDGTTEAVITGSLVGVVGAEDVALSGSGTFASSAPGAGIVVTSSLTLTGADAGNYTLTQPTGLTGTITAKALTVSGAAVTTRVYDGTTAATITGATLVGVVGTEDVGVTGGGTFNDKTAGSGKTVTADLELTGADAGNYTLTQPTGLTGTITAKALTTSGATAQSKVYDGTTAATITGATLVGAVGGDIVTLSGGGTFDDKTVGAGKVVTADLSLSGADAGNYTLTQPTGLTADVTAKELTVTGATVSAKTYNGDTSAVITGAQLSGVESGDTVTLDNAISGTFATANAGSGISVTTSMSLSGADAGNYTLTQPTLAGDITQATQTITFEALNEVSIGSTTALTATANSGLAVTFTSSNTDVATIDGSNVVAVAPGTTTITANQAGDGNYAAAEPVVRSLTVNSGPTVLAAGDIALIELQTDNPDNFAFVALVDLNAGTEVKFTDNAWSGSSLATNEGTITWTASVTVSRGTVVTYDGTAFSTGTASGTSLSLAVGGDAVIAYQGSGESPTFIYALASNGWIIAGSTTSNTSYLPTGLVNGTTARDFDTEVDNNYFNVTPVSGSKESILAAIGNADNWLRSDAIQTTPNWSFTVKDEQIITFEALSAVTYGDAPFALTATATSGLTVSFTSSDESVATVDGSTVTVIGAGSATITASQAGDVTYATATPVARTLTVNQKALTGGFTASGKIYDGTAAATVATRSVSGKVGEDDVNHTGGTATFSDANAGDSKTVTLTGASLTGAAAGNYSLSSVSTTTANITKATPTITAAPTASAITEGQTLASSNLSGGTATGVGGGALEGNFAFTSSGTTPAVGTANQGVTFTPTDTTNYNTATTSVSVTVNSAAAELPVDAAVAFVDGNYVIVDGEGNPLAGATYTYSYAGRSVGGLTETYAFLSYSSASAPTAPGFYTVTVTAGGDYTGSLQDELEIAGPLALPVGEAIEPTKIAGASTVRFNRSTLLGTLQRVTSEGTLATGATGLSWTGVTAGSSQMPAGSPEPTLTNTVTHSATFVTLTPPTSPSGAKSDSDSFTLTVSDGVTSVTYPVTVTSAAAPEFDLVIRKLVPIEGDTNNMKAIFLTRPNRTVEMSFRPENAGPTNWFNVSATNQPISTTTQADLNGQQQHVSRDPQKISTGSAGVLEFKVPKNAGTMFFRAKPVIPTNQATP